VSSPWLGRITRVRRRPFAILLGVALAALALACTSAEERVARHLERARVYGGQSQPQKALIELQSALKLDPKNFEVNLLTAEQLIEMERMEDALFYYEEARRLDPMRDEAALGVAQLLLFQETDRAEKLVDEVLARSPGNATAHVMRSDVWLIRKDLDAALASAFTALELEPRNPRMALQVAVVRKAFVADKTQQGEKPDPALVKEAEDAFASAAELAAQEQQAPWLVRATLERVQLMSLDKERGPEIAALLRDGYEQLSGYPREANNLLATARRFARVSKDLEFEHWALSRIVELQPARYEVWTRLADVAAERGEDRFAVMDRLVKERPADARAHTAYAEYLSRHGRNADALAHLEKVLPDVDQGDVLLAALASLYLKSRDTDGATQALARLREDHPESPQTFFAEVSVAKAEGRHADALAALERWAARDEAPQPLSMLAEARLRAGNPRDALDAIDRAIAASAPPPREFHRLRGRILVALGDHQAALQAFATSRDRRRPVPLEYVPDVARALYALGRVEPARQTLQRALDRERPAPAALVLLAREEAERDPVAARQALERGAALYPNVPAFVDMLVTADLRAGKLDEALAQAQAAVERMPDSPRVQMTLVRTLVAARRMDDAVQQVEIVRERWPGQIGVAELYLDVMMRAGRGDQAFQVLSQQHAAGSLAPQGRVLLARLHVSRGEDEKGRGAAALGARRRVRAGPRAERPRLPARAAREVAARGNRARAGGARQPPRLARDRRHARLRLPEARPRRGGARAVRRRRRARRAGEHGLGHRAVPPRPRAARARAPRGGDRGDRAGARFRGGVRAVPGGAPRARRARQRGAGRAGVLSAGAPERPAPADAPPPDRSPAAGTWIRSRCPSERREPTGHVGRRSPGSAQAHQPFLAPEQRWGSAGPLPGPMCDQRSWKRQLAGPPGAIAQAAERQPELADLRRELVSGVASRAASAHSAAIGESRGRLPPRWFASCSRLRAATPGWAPWAPARARRASCSTPPNGSKSISSTASAEGPAWPEPIRQSMRNSWASAWAGCRSEKAASASSRRARALQSRAAWSCRASRISRVPSPSSAAPSGSDSAR
jgi:tetratricopeptide (TPR) repeat protein